MYYFINDFEMVPETVTQGDKWIEKVGLVIWSKQPFVSRVTVLRHALSTVPKRTMIIEVRSLDELQKFMSSPERLKGRSEFEKFVRKEMNIFEETMFQSNK